MLPSPLLCLTQLILFQLVYAQKQIPVDSSSTFSGASTIAIPASAGPLAISVALCAFTDTSPRFILTNSSQNRVPSTSDLGQPDVFEIQVADGIGNWTGLMGNGGVLVATATGNSPYEVGVSSGGAPIHQYLGDKQFPLLGDSTSNQVLLFSHVFENITKSTPYFPNYTFSSAQTPFAASSPSRKPAFDLALLPTSSSFGALSKSGCALQRVKSTGTIANQSLWLKGDGGWRSQWFIEGLAPQTNYSAYVIQDGTKVSGPMSFVTKTSSFDCPLVHSLPYCPSVSWAVPLPNPPGSDLYDALNLPSNISTPLQQYLTNFTTMLSTFACGRDIYSPIQSCANCQAEYRHWLCTISFPRCGEPITNTSSPIAAALVPQNLTSTIRNPNFPPFQGTYSELLPCLEVCHATDRACPYFLGFQCPQRKFTASLSYGVGYIDSDHGIAGEGSTGVAQDRYGNIWCNGG